MALPVPAADEGKPRVSLPALPAQRLQRRHSTTPPPYQPLCCSAYDGTTTIRTLDSESTLAFGLEATASSIKLYGLDQNSQPTSAQCTDTLTAASTASCPERTALDANPQVRRRGGGCGSPAGSSQAAVHVRLGAHSASAPQLLASLQ